MIVFKRKIKKEIKRQELIIQDVRAKMNANPKMFNKQKKELSISFWNAKTAIETLKKLINAK